MTYVVLTHPLIGQGDQHLLFAGFCSAAGGTVVGHTESSAARQQAGGGRKLAVS